MRNLHLYICTVPLIALLVRGVGCLTIHIGHVYLLDRNGRVSTLAAPFLYHLWSIQKAKNVQFSSHQVATLSPQLAFEISAIFIGLLSTSMSTIDLLTRVNTVIKKYEKYDPEKEKGATDIPSHDHWLKLYTSLQDDLNDALKVFSRPKLHKMCP